MLNREGTDPYINPAIGALRNKLDIVDEMRLWSLLRQRPSPTALCVNGQEMSPGFGQQYPNLGRQCP